jgi:hypothetical protein
VSSALACGPSAITAAPAVRAASEVSQQRDLRMLHASSAASMLAHGFPQRSFGGAEATIERRPINHFPGVGTARGLLANFRCAGHPSFQTLPYTEHYSPVFNR